MNKYLHALWQFFQYGYLLIAVLFLISAITSWKTDLEGSVLKIVFSIFIVLVFFLKRHFRKKMAKGNAAH